MGVRTLQNTLRIQEIKIIQLRNILVAGFAFVWKSTRAFTTNRITKTALVFLRKGIEITVFAGFTLLSATLALWV